MTTTNRETVRDALAVLLEAALVGSGKPAQAFYGYPVGDFGALSPVVTLASAGSSRKRLTVSDLERATLRFDVHVFVLYTDKADWNEDDAEDALDLIEKAVYEVVGNTANQAGANPWTILEYDDAMTVVDWTEIGGHPYRYEIIPLRVTVGS